MCTAIICYCDSWNYDSVTYDLVKPSLWVSEAEAEEKTNHSVWFQALLLIALSISASDSDSLVFTESYVMES